MELSQSSVYPLAFQQPSLILQLHQPHQYVGQCYDFPSSQMIT